MGRLSLGQQEGRFTARKAEEAWLLPFESQGKECGWRLSHARTSPGASKMQAQPIHIYYYLQRGTANSHTLASKRVIGQ